MAKLEKQLAKISNKNNLSSKNKLDNKFPTGWVIGGGIAIVAGGLIMLVIIRKFKRKKGKKGR
ncbi:MAG: hypothetical protein I3274_05815 [Candidatus Moeniiplasma glomeromycotorum]|nr:hypothetical protein [Candidatus Moeniiplasma glomeromycotorum]